MKTKSIQQKLILSFGIFLGFSACSLTPQERPLDPTTLPGLLLSLYRPSAEQLPVSGVSFWIRADDAVNQSGLTIWPDRSGFGSTIAGPQIQIEGNRVNGRPAVLFPGSQPYRLDGLANQLISNTFSVLTVFRNATPSSAINQAFVNIGSSSGGIEFGLDFTSERLILLKSDLLAVLTGVTTITNTSTYYMTSLTYDASGNGVIYLNGTSDVTGTNLQTFTNNGQITIGGRTDDTEYFKGHLAEVIVFTHSLSVTDRQLLECYLSRRYAISVPFACP